MSHEAIQAAVRAKGSHYGALDHPLLVAGNVDALSVERNDEAHEITTLAFLAINPQKVIPALVSDDGEILYQSMATVEYLNFNWLTPNRS